MSGSPAAWKSTEMTAVYRFYAADGSLIYVGITNSLQARFLRHSEGKPWWPEVARKTVRWYPTRVEAATAEDAVLIALSPRFNSQKRSGPAVEPRTRDYIGAYAAEKGISRERSARLVRADREALREALAALRRAQEAIAEHFEAIRREAPGDDGVPCESAPVGPRTAARDGEDDGEYKAVSRERFAPSALLVVGW